jgi:LmbE family N-acetylglucosaminyl deacetylase
MLGHNKRVLMIGAHPDDEDTELLTILVRGMGAEAAYLSLNRGEGGQNLIGPELGEALGLIRTEELLAARRLDGARQYFTRAYDFGYSKSIEETWQHWPRDSVLKDVVRMVRRFRPQVLVTIFSGTPRDGHGQHQAAGWVAQEAFRIAGDSSRFRELFREEGLVPWSPFKLYRSTRFDSAATTLVLNGGVLDPAVGKSFHQIAMAGRSLHRSQDMGQLQRIGPSLVRLALIEDRTAGGAGLFEGIDTTLAAMPLGERRGHGAAALVYGGEPQPALNRYAARVDSVVAAKGNPARRRTLLARAAAEVIRVNNAYPELNGWAMIGGWPLFTTSLLTDLDPKRIKVVSVDALAPQLAYVEKDIVPVLLAQPVYKWGYVGVQTIVDKVHLKKEVPTMIAMELVRVTKENLGEWAKQLQAWGFTDVPERYLKP